MLGFSDKRKQTPPAPTGGKSGLDLSNAKDWEDMHKKMFSGVMDKTEAYADRILVTDDELPLFRHIQLLTIVAVVFTFIIWASFAHIDQVTHGDGKVIPSAQIQIVQHQEGGIVDAFLVKEGDRVKSGQVLMRLRDVGASSDLGASTQKYYGLQAKIARLQAEADGAGTPVFSDEIVKAVPESVQQELNTFKANRLKLDSEISVLKSQLNQRQQEVNELQTKITDTSRVISLAREETNMIRPLVEKGSAPKRDLLQMEQQMASHQTDMNGYQAALPRARSAVVEAQARLADAVTQMRATAQADLAQTQIDVQTIGQTLGALEDKKSRTDIRSPVDGIVKDIKINTVGGVVKPGDDVVEVVPDDGNLVVEARVRPADIAFIGAGQKATVKLTAYDFSIYGGLPAEVVDISADSITNEKGESFYRVKVRTKLTTLKHDGQELPIIPGMVATVDILTGKRTVMQYMLKPFFKTLDSAMGER